MPDVKQLLMQSTLFEGARNIVINTLLQCAETVRFSAGEIPVAEATVTDRILMVFEGEVQLEVALQAPDQELKLLRAGPGTFFAAPPGVRHGFAIPGPANARFVNIHLPGIGFFQSVRERAQTED